MDERITRALARGHTIDITTTGRKTGQPRRIEVMFHNIGGRIYISGRPGFRRSWIANLEANPRFTFHLKSPVRADLPATARVISDEKERRVVLEDVARAWGTRNVDVMVKGSPLVEVTIDGSSPSAKPSVSR